MKVANRLFEVGFSVAFQFPLDGHQRLFFAVTVTDYALLFFAVVLIYHKRRAAEFAGVYIPKGIA